MQRDAGTMPAAQHAYSRAPDLSLQMVGSPPLCKYGWQATPTCGTIQE